MTINEKTAPDFLWGIFTIIYLPAVGIYFILIVDKRNVMPDRIQHSFLYRNSLSLVLLILAIICIISQVFAGMNEYNKFLREHSMEQVAIYEYLHSGHFLQATFENWESEFFQMGLFVWFTVFLRQIGSSESKKLSGKEAVDRPPQATKNSPWPVKKGGWILAVYKHSLSIFLFTMFLVSFILHWYGSNLDYNDQQILNGGETESLLSYLSNSRLWFESFQNWQSEFISVLAIVFLSIYLREFGSPQSKPVDAPHFETGE